MENHIQKILCDSAKNVIESVLEIDFRTGTYTTVFTAATQTLPYGEQSWNVFTDRFAGNYSVSGRKYELERALSLENIKLALSTDGNIVFTAKKSPAKNRKDIRNSFLLPPKNRMWLYFQSLISAVLPITITKQYSM